MMTAAVVASIQTPQPALAPNSLLLSIVVPTYNEKDNVDELLARLSTTLADISWEVIFVDDDSPDGTADYVRAKSLSDAHVRCVHRIGRRGLSSACVEGILATAAPFVAVMDADLQHDESKLPEMLRVLRTENVDVVVGSRYVGGGGIGDWQGDRAAMSRFATRLSHLVLKVDLKDPMSGFFLFRREAFAGAVRNLSNIGFKILLDIFASSPRPLTFREVAYEFRTRHAGTSKLDARVMWDYLMMLTDKLIGHIIPVRFVAFSVVGGFGALVHMLTLAVLYEAFSSSFTTAQIGATVVSMTSNFFLNNVITYGDKRLKGWSILRGLLIFYAACSIGAIGNVGVAQFIFAHNYSWWLSGVAGVLISAVWNYAATALYIWKR